jgi:hypothetical protein
MEGFRCLLGTRNISGSKQMVAELAEMDLKRLLSLIQVKLTKQYIRGFRKTIS